MGDSIITYVLVLPKQLSGVTEKTREISVMTVSHLGHSSWVS
jgi:hypothetical protein